MRAVPLFLVVFSLASFAQTPKPPLKSDCAADGFVVNALTGEPVARAHIGVMPANVGVVADANGRWSVANVTCGRVQITATKPGFLMGGVGMPTPDGVFQVFTLTSQSPAQDVKLPLTPQSVATGRVIDEFGDPVFNTQVSAMTSRVIQGRRAFQISASGRTNDLGEYRIAGLPAGRYIFCTGAGAPTGMPQGGGGTFADTCYPGPIEGGLASSMELTAGRETQVNFSLREVPAFKVAGTVAGLPKGGGVALSLQSKNASESTFQPIVRSTNIGKDGVFEFRSVPAGTYDLISDFWEEGARLTARQAVTVSSDVSGINLRLEPAITLTGTVQIVSAGGNVLPHTGWALNLRSTDRVRGGGGQLRWNKDRNTFTVTDLTPGTYTLDATPPAPFYLKSALMDGRDISRESLPVSRSGARLDLVLGDDSGSVEGTVEDQDGQPPARAWVMVLQDGRAPKTAVVGADGHFKVAGLAPGEYQVCAWNDIQSVEYAEPEWMKSHATTQSVVVPPNQAASIKLVMQTNSSR